MNIFTHLSVKQDPIYGQHLSDIVKASSLQYHCDNDGNLLIIIKRKSRRMQIEIAPFQPSSRLFGPLSKPWPMALGLLHVETFKHKHDNRFIDSLQNNGKNSESSKTKT